MVDKKNKEMIVVYHGAISLVKFHNLAMWGPVKGKRFFVTPDKKLAINAAKNQTSQVLEYIIPKEEAKEILGEAKPYMGCIQMTPSIEYEIPKNKSYQIHKFLNSKQKLNPY